mgnify:CR=1 FL=1
MFYHELFRELERFQVKYLLIGGLAVNLHGIPRMTMDVDLWVDLDVDNLQNFFKAVASLHLKPVLPVKLSELAMPSQRQIWIDARHMIAFSLSSEKFNYPTVDLLLVSPLDFNLAYERRETRSIAEVNVSLIAVPDLLRLKEAAARAQDAADIEHLKRLHNEK